MQGQTGCLGPTRASSSATSRWEKRFRKLIVAGEGELEGVVKQARHEGPSHAEGWGALVPCSLYLSSFPRAAVKKLQGLTSSKRSSGSRRSGRRRRHDEYLFDHRPRA